MKVGEYVRTKNGEIGKLVNVEVYYVLGQDDKDKYSCVLFNNSYIHCIVSNDFIIKKGQLIDLIEVGDIIRGKDNHLFEVYAVGSDCVYINNLEEFILVNEIKSIVTHEQFSQIEYRIGE